jgi:hypothetical protein
MIFIMKNPGSKETAGFQKHERPEYYDPGRSTNAESPAAILAERTGLHLSNRQAAKEYAAIR